MQQEPNPYIPQQRQDINTVTPDDLYASQMQEDKVKNLIQQIAPDNQLMELQWRIKGYVKNTYTGQWEKVEKDAPEPSPLLVSRYISYLSSVLNQNTTLSNYSSSEINDIMKLCIEWVSDDLDCNAEDYGIDYDYNEMTRIGDILLMNTFTVLKRAQNGMESRRIFSSLKIAESMNPFSQKKESMWDAIKFWK